MVIAEPQILIVICKHLLMKASDGDTSVSFGDAISFGAYLRALLLVLVAPKTAVEMYLQRWSPSHIHQIPPPVPKDHCVNFHPQ